MNSQETSKIAFVAIIFALLAGGTLFGLTGMFLAVPVAAVIGVLLSFSINQYKNSPYYDNKAPDAQPMPSVQVVVQVTPEGQSTVTSIDNPEATTS